MKAIVLSCDKYHSFAHHMLLTYQAKWPTNRFMFRIPWNNHVPGDIKSDFDNVEFIRTEVPLKKTIDSLLTDMDDSEWVYWCVDDKYLIDIDQHKANQVVQFVNSVEDQNITGISFMFTRDIKRTAQQKSDSIVQYEDLRFLPHTSSINNWLHQFYRVKNIKQWMDYLPDPEIYKMRALDVSPFLIPGTLLTLDHSISVYGESTSGGEIMDNCVDSFKSYGLPLPEGFNIQQRRVIIK